MDTALNSGSIKIRFTKISRMKRPQRSRGNSETLRLGKTPLLPVRRAAVLYLL